MFTQPGAVTAPAATSTATPSVAMLPAGTYPTPEQASIIGAARTGEDLVIEAGAGTGKTTTLKMLGKLVPTRALYLAYNRAIADDARMSFPGNVHCATAHSLAFQAIGRNYSDRLNGPRLPARETARILGVGAVLDLGKHALTQFKVVRLVMDTVAAFCNSDDNEVYTAHVPDVPGLSPESATALRMEVVPLARRAWADLSTPEGKLRFTHDCYLKMWALTTPELPYGLVMLDEAQDANPVIAGIVMRQSAQRVLVGDRSQAIYGWRGAVDAMDDFLATGAKRFVLSQSFRFGQAIADEANEWLGLLDAPLRLSGNPAMNSRLEMLPGPDAILCRTNAGAVATVMVGLKHTQDRFAMVGGGDDIRRLAEACRELKSGRGTSHPELMAFATWGEVQDYAEHDSGGSDLKTFVKLVDSHGPEAIIGLVGKLVDEHQAGTVVSTAHKAKGREWDTVRLADDFGEHVDPQTGELLRPEVMLTYVAVTRAKHVLDLGALFDDDPPAVESVSAKVAIAELGNILLSDRMSPPEPGWTVDGHGVPHRDEPAEEEVSEPATAGKVELPVEAAGWLNLAKEAAENAAKWKAIADHAEEKLKELLGDAEEANLNGMPAITWKWSKPGGGIDGTALKKDHPEIHAKYYKAKKPARPFKLTGAWK